jgi:hypothetical protein
MHHHVRHPHPLGPDAPRPFGRVPVHLGRDAVDGVVSGVSGATGSAHLLIGPVGAMDFPKSSAMSGFPN